jgi:pilus assembly protein TadC
MIKIKSGAPFFNSLIGASKFYGTTGDFFRSIVDEINTGKSIEDALKDAVEYSPSQKMSRVLREVNTALRLGIDIGEPIKNILDDIYNEHMNDIEKYSKKMTTLTLFYMIFGIIVPSLGIVALTLVGAFLGFEIRLIHLFFVIFVIGFFQFLFLTIFISSRPLVNT